MRRVLISLLSTVALVGESRAQVRHIGIKGGFGQGSFTGANEFAWRSDALRASAFIMQSGVTWSLQTEVSISEKLGVSNAVPGSTLNFSATFLDLPVFVRFAPPPILSIQPFLLAGPMLTYRVDCNLQFVTAGLTSDGPCEASGGAHPLDLGASVGAGLSRAFGRTTFLAEIRGSANQRSVAVPLAATSSRAVSWSVLLGASVPVSSRSPTVGPIPVQRTMPAPVASAASPAPDLLPAFDIVGSGLVPLAAEPTPAAATDTVRAQGRISVTAVNADARALLLAIARESGISLVVSDDVRRRVSVSFTNASPDEAIAAIIAQAGLTIVRPPTPVLPPVVYYQLPVNVNQAPAEVIAVRFGVSLELARLIAGARSSDRP